MSYIKLLDSGAGLLYQADIADEKKAENCTSETHLCFTQIPLHMHNFGIPLKSVVTSEL